MRVEANPREITGQPVQEGENQFSAEIAQALPTDAPVQGQPQARYDRLCQVENLSQQIAGAEAQLLGSLTAGAGVVITVLEGMGGLSEGNMQDAVSGITLGGAMMSGGEVVRTYGVRLHDEASDRSCRIR